jgi:hypothetical protein
VIRFAALPLTHERFDTIERRGVAGCGPRYCEPWTCSASSGVARRIIGGMVCSSPLPGAFGPWSKVHVAVVMNVLGGDPRPSQRGC